MTDTFEGHPFAIPVSAKQYACHKWHKRWGKIYGKAKDRYGKKVLHICPIIGHAVTAWVILTAVVDPAGAVAEQLNIPRDMAEDLLDSGEFQLGDSPPPGGLDKATLADGTIIYVGMAAWYAELDHLRKVTGVHDAEILYIVPTGQSGIYSVTVKVGQGRSTEPRTSRWVVDPPEVGTVVPYDPFF